MRWKIIKLIYLREMRDQLRDRRTLFLIAVLPLLLYPLLGTSFFQLMQFVQQKASVLIVGGEELEGIPWLPPLVDDGKFAQALFDDPQQREQLQLSTAEKFPELAKASTKQSADGEEPPADFDAATRRLLDEGEVDVVLQFPAGFGARLLEMRRALVERNAADATPFPEPVILFNSADEKSQFTQLQVEQIFRRWRSAVTDENLSASQVPVEATKPFELRPRDVARVKVARAAVWSKVLPFFVFIWALTGAFYPAVDLCAGEKERGTLETLLTSPASRREIVWGKLLTVMTFSIATALLNFGSLGLTGRFVIDHMATSGLFGEDMARSLPSLGSVAWLALALIPISAFFGALCLACAAYARSTKEGQYYLMPLMLVILPLMMLPMSPGVELNLGNSLVPVTGLVLLLRAVIEGQYHVALQFVAPVVAVTMAGCLLAIRWAEEQFNRESVLFRESERLELGRWLVHLVRDRGETPSFAQAALCLAIILVVQFFISVVQSTTSVPDTFAALAKSVLVVQLACIFAPAALMTIMLTRRPVRTLLLERTPAWRHLWAAAGIALLIHPVAMRFSELVQRLYPVPEETVAAQRAIEGALNGAPSLWLALALMALLPALCEELAFRGFILSGARHLGHKWWAIGFSALAFGMVHAFLHQKINAAAMGMVIGYVAVQTGSLWPCVLLHAVHNSVAFCIPELARRAENNPGSPVAFLLGGDEPLLYHPVVVAACVAGVAAILWGLHGVSYRRTAEEQLEEARQQQNAALAGAS